MTDAELYNKAEKAYKKSDYYDPRPASRIDQRYTKQVWIDGYISRHKENVLWAHA